jgi:hypothetical protein
LENEAFPVEEHEDRRGKKRDPVKRLLDPL